MALILTDGRSLARADAPADADGTYLGQLRRQREMWETKPAVRAQYHYWYEMIAGQMADLSPSVELGCGCGNFKAFRPDVIATDAIATPWCDQVVDACRMPFDDGSVGNLILFDVLHHIPEPLQVLQEASRVLRPHGRIIIVEPLLTCWSRIVYRFHHEPFDESSDLLSPSDRPVRSADYANGATATILFDIRRDELLQRTRGLRWVSRRDFSFVAYPLTGGFQPFCLIPARTVKTVSRIEDFVISRMGCRFLALRTMVVLEKNNETRRADRV